MSPKIDLSCFSLHAVNFDNAVELDAVSELITNNLSQTECEEFRSYYSVTDEDIEYRDLVSMLVCYEGAPIGHVAFEFDEESGNVIIIAPVVERSFENLRHFINSMIWRALARLSKRQSWGRVLFSCASYGDIPSLDGIEFRSIVVDIFPGSSAAFLRNQIEIVHGKMEIVDIREDHSTQIWPNNARI